jgi:hypothetical protein
MIRYCNSIFVLLLICHASFFHREISAVAVGESPSPTNNALLQDVTSRFSNVLLVVNFNFPYYDNIPFLLKLWSPIFKHIVFFGPVPRQALREPRGRIGNYRYEFDSPRLLLTFLDEPQRARRRSAHKAHVTTFESQHGNLGYVSMINAMHRFPFHSGYLYTNDDIFMNWPLLSSLNGSQAWSEYLRVQDVSVAWGRWKRSDTMDAFRLAYAQLPSPFQQRLTTAMANMPADKRLVGYDYTAIPPAIHAESDVFYVPQRLRKDFIVVATKFAEQQTFLEVAVPNTILAIIRKRYTYQQLHGLYLWYEQRKFEILRDCFRYSLRHKKKKKKRKTRAF